MTAERADTPAKRIYFAVQTMYTASDPRVHHNVYFALIRDIVEAAPSTWPHIEIINNHILSDELYKALRQSRKLVEYEQKLIQNASRDACLPKNGARDGKLARTGIQSAIEVGGAFSSHPR
jgi:flagellar protein FlbT